MSQDIEIEALGRRLLGKEAPALGERERHVLSHLAAKAPISRDAVEEAVDARSGWDRLADRVARVGGSWTFIFSFGAVLLSWMFLNSQVLSRLGVAFDPYPFIFLNLLLSTVAALQAPVIMMSQNRQNALDRAAASHDYEVNLRAELEIMGLHEKMDRMRAEQTDALLVQQTLLLEAIRTELAGARGPGRPPRPER